MNKINKFFYGWWMVFVITILLMTSSAAPLSVVLKQLMGQFHTGRGEISLCQSIWLFTMGVTGIFIGKLVLLYRPRTFMLWGSLLGGAGCLFVSLANSLWVFYFFYFVIGVAAGFSNVIAYFTLLSKWFIRKWGTALGIAFAGQGVGSLMFQPIVGIIAQKFGWRATYLFAGSLVLAINAPLILFVLKDNPESMGLLPDGDRYKEIISPINRQPSVETSTGSNAATKNNRLLSYIKSPALWLVSISFALVSIGYSAVTTQEVSFITDMKISTTIAASAFGITLGIGAISSVVSGWLADRLVSRYVTILFVLLAIVGMLILMHADTISKIWLFVVIYGLGIGAPGILLPIVTRDIFGTTNFSAIFGIIVVLYAFGNAIGAPLAGFMFDATASYRSTFIIITATYAVAILGIYFSFGANPKPLLRIALLKKQNHLN